MVAEYKFNLDPSDCLFYTPFSDKLYFIIWFFSLWYEISTTQICM